MATCISAKELWSDTQPERPVLIMGNSESVRMFDETVYDRFYTIGCNSRLHRDHVPDLTLMVDRALPTPPDDADIMSHLPHWQTAHPGTCYTYTLGQKLQFHPDLSDARIDFAHTSAYMAVIVAYLMGYRSITFVGIDLGAVNGRDRIDSPGSGVSNRRQMFFNEAFNHLSFLINKMAKYYKCQFFSLSPHSRLLMNGHVRPANL